MTDLIERLRGTWAWSHGRPVNPDGPEAADEIERLRKENKLLRKATQGLINNACAACDENYIILCTKKEWDSHVKATAFARTALEGK